MIDIGVSGKSFDFLTVNAKSQNIFYKTTFFLYYFITIASFFHIFLIFS